MRGDLALVVLALSPVLMAPKGCYYGSDVVPLGYNVGGNAFGDEAGAPALDEAGCSSRAGGGGTGAVSATGGADAGGTSPVGGPSDTQTGGTGGASGGRSPVVLLRPH